MGADPLARAPRGQRRLGPAPPARRIGGHMGWRGTDVAGVAMSLGLLFLLGPAGAQATPATDEVRSRLGGVRVPFITNEGQVDSRVAYYAPTFAGTLFVTRQGELVHA